MESILVTCAHGYLTVSSLSPTEVREFARRLTAEMPHARVQVLEEKPQTAATNCIVAW